MLVDLDVKVSVMLVPEPVKIIVVDVQIPVEVIVALLVQMPVLEIPVQVVV